MKNIKTLALAALLATLSAVAAAQQQAAKTPPEGKAYTIRSAASAVGGGTVAYQWYRNDVPITNATAVSYTVPANGAYGTNVRFKRRANCGGDEMWSNTVLVSFVPDRHAKIMGNEVICNSGETQTYSVPYVASVTFAWTVPLCCTITSGQNTNIITITCLDNCSGMVSVTPSSTAFGYLITGTPDTLTIFGGVPDFSGYPVVGDGTVCAHQEGLTYTAKNIQGLSYAWDVPSDWTITAGDGTNSITVTAGSASGHVRATPHCNNNRFNYPSTRSVTAVPCASCIDGTVINNLCWANRNVGQPGSFAASPHDYGYLYTWMGTTAHAVTGEEPNYNPNFGVGSPCPAGWRLPDYGSLSSDGTWAAAGEKGNTVAGLFWGDNHATCSFGDSMVGCIFLPAAGSRMGDSQYSVSGTGTDGCYWTNRSAQSGVAYYSSFNSATLSGNLITAANYSLSVRCVQDLP